MVRRQNSVLVSLNVIIVWTYFQKSSIDSSGSFNLNVTIIMDSLRRLNIFLLFQKWLRLRWPLLVILLIIWRFVLSLAGEGRLAGSTARLEDSDWGARSLLEDLVGDVGHQDVVDVKGLQVDLPLSRGRQASSARPDHLNRDLRLRRVLHLLLFLHLLLILLPPQVQIRVLETIETLRTAGYRRSPRIVTTNLHILLLNHLFALSVTLGSLRSFILCSLLLVICKRRCRVRALVQIWRFSALKLGRNTLSWFSYWSILCWESWCRLSFG